MGLFHKHGHEDDGPPAEAASFEVLGADGVTTRYAREEFDMIVATTDPEEVQRQTGLGWVILDEREVEECAGRGPSGDDLIVGIDGLRVGGMLGYQAGTTSTSYTIGFLRDGAKGEPVR